jgi:hypothetical protein
MRSSTSNWWRVTPSGVPRSSSSSVWASIRTSWPVPRLVRLSVSSIASRTLVAARLEGV